MADFNYYQAYGIPIKTKLKLEALVPIHDLPLTNPLEISLCKVPQQLNFPAIIENPYGSFNDTEFIFKLDKIAHFYISDGQQIILEPKCDNWDEICLQLYANAFSIALLQRNLIPFHVSGVFVDENKVLLLAAPSGTGKSTTALMLQQRGYKLFTDDTALLYIENGKCMARASYPMARFWQETLAVQSQYDESEKQRVFGDIEKYGFSFHDSFQTAAAEVVGMVYLNKEGNEIEIKEINPLEHLKQLNANIYRDMWVTALKKTKTRFKLVSDIVNTVPGYMATRPADRKSFKGFAGAVIENVILQYQNKTL